MFIVAPKLWGKQEYWLSQECVAQFQICDKEATKTMRSLQDKSFAAELIPLRFTFPAPFIYQTQELLTHCLCGKKS